MTRTIIALVFCSGLAVAADVTGKWNVTAQAPNGREYKLELELKSDNGKLTGAMSSPQGSITLQDVQLSDKELSYKLPVGEASYAIKLTVSDSSMKGTFTGPDGTTGSVIAMRPAAGGGVAGKWKATAQTPSGREYKLELNIKEDGGKLNGTLTSEQGSIDLQETKFENGELSFKLVTDQGTYKIKLAVTGDTAKGNYTDAGGQTGSVVATR